MEPITFAAGLEKRFFDFISRLNEKDKIALVSHTDLDGVASAKVANEVLNADVLKFVDYIDINEKLVHDLKSRQINKIIFTDLDFDKVEIIRALENFAEVLVIDHHIFSSDLNSNKTVFLSAPGYCSSYICYYLFSKTQNITKWDWLVAAASLSDFCYTKITDWLMQVKEKYGDKFSIEEMSKLSKIYDLAHKLSLTLIYFRENLNEAYRMIGDNIDNLGNLDNYARDVQKEIDESALQFEKERKVLRNGDVLFWEFKPEFFIKSILINGLSMKYKDKTIIIIEDNRRYFEVSARRHDGKVNLVEMMKNLTSGFKATSGGHMCAVGATILPPNIYEFRERVKSL
jgi:single-stranded DNA-specific DHH superfamily exonuclease